MIIGSEKELSEVEYLPESVCLDIGAVLNVLDEAYGANRDVTTADGGFVAVIDDITMCDTLLDRFNLDINTDIFEYEEHIDGYVKRLYILSSDFSIVTYIREGLL